MMATKLPPPTSLPTLHNATALLSSIAFPACLSATLFLPNSHIMDEEPGAKTRDTHSRGSMYVCVSGRMYISGRKVWKSEYVTMK